MDAIIFFCPRCGATGPFEHLIEMTQAIEVTFKEGADHPYLRGSDRHIIVEDAVVSEEAVSEAGYRCGCCYQRFDRPTTSLTGQTAG